MTEKFVNRRFATKLLLASAMTACVPMPGFAASPELIAAAKAEGSVVWYTTMIVDQAVRPLVAAFEAKYPEIKVEFSRAGSGDTALKLIQEGQAGKPQADVFDGTATYASVGPAGFVEPYMPDAAADYPPELHDKDGNWHALNLYFVTAGINTDMVSAEDAPKTFEDLLDPKWQGKMVWSTVPEPTAAPGFVGNVLMSMGEEKGMAYLKALSAQNITNMTSSQRTVLDRVIVGDFPIGLSVFNHHVAISQAEGAPVDWLKINPLASSASLVSLVKGGPHPNAGKLLVDFLISKEGQEALATTGYIPAHPQVPAADPSLKPSGAPDDFVANFMSPEVVAQSMPGWLEIMNAEFH